MSGLPPPEFNYPSAGQQSFIPTSDSRLLDAAETLVTLQSRGGGRGRHSGKEITYLLTSDFFREHSSRPKLCEMAHYSQLIE